MTIVLHQVGPRHGVKDYLRQVFSSMKQSEFLPGAKTAQQCLIRGLGPSRSAEIIEKELREGHRGGTLLHIETLNETRLGKPVPVVWADMAVHSVIRRDDVHDDGRAEEALGVTRITFRMANDRIVLDGLRCNVLLSLHALERVYERDEVMTGGMPERLRRSFRHAMHGLAVTCQNDIGLAHPDDGQDALLSDGSPSTWTRIVPFGTGLLIVEQHVCVTRNQPSARFDIRRRTAVAKTGPMPSHEPTAFMLDGQQAFVQVMHVGRTYLSQDSLRPEQIAYRDDLQRILDATDEAGMIADEFHARDPHLPKPSPTPVDPVAVERLKTLLPSCVRRSNSPSTHWVICSLLEGESIGSVQDAGALKRSAAVLEAAGSR